MNKKLKTIVGDGNCLFRSLAFSHYGNQRYHKQLRHEVVNYVIRNWTYFEPFIIGDQSYSVAIGNPHEYANHMSTDGVFGGEIEVTAFLKIFPQYSIHIYFHQIALPEVFGEGQNCIYLQYSGEYDRGHYDVVIPPVVSTRKVEVSTKKPDSRIPAPKRKQNELIDVAPATNELRRKRYATLPAQDSTIPLISELDSKKTRNIGRPKRVLHNGGRPKKNSDELQVQVPKKMGRPKKEIIHTAEIEEIKLKNDSLEYKCPYCGALLFNEESSRVMWCCGKGRIKTKFPKLDALFYEDSNFLNDSRSYNNLFSFSALGVTGGFQSPKTGPSLVKILGRIYHRIFDLNYSGKVNNSLLYICDGMERLKLAEERKLDPNIVTQISKYLDDVNPLVTSLKKLNDENSESAHLIFEQTTRKISGPILGDLPTCGEIAGILRTTPTSDPRKIIIWKKNSREPQFIHFLDPAYESLQYPLLFPHASAGWSVGMVDEQNRKISQTKYYRYLLLAEPRFTLMSRLGQEYFVDMWCRTEEEKLQFIRYNQAKFLRVASRNEIDESIAAEGGPKAGKIYLPSSYTQGPRYMQLKYQDGMAIVARLGKPTFFITVTCNPKWTEITSNLYDKQSHIDRPDLCCRVFQLKLNKLLKLLRSGVIFGDMVYVLYVIEFQKRGLPHAHIALGVKDGCSMTSDDINKFVHATIPEPDEEGGKLQKLVLKHMVHGPCGIENNPNSPCMENNQCNKSYPKQQVENTYLDERGYVHYRRPCSLKVMRKNKKIIDDRWIVPYNPTLLLLMNCHCNVEIASSVKIIKYLFKYIHKGPDMAKVAILPKLSDEIDEVENYVNSRYISASEAIWRLLEFDISARNPTVIALPVHLPTEEQIIFETGKEIEALENNVSKLNLYFHRPKTEEFKNLTYLDFYERYNIVHKNNTRVVFAYSDQKHFLTKRVRGECVARMFWLSPTLGEVYYLRLLLSKFPSFGYNDLKMYNGENFATFQDVAYARGLLDDAKEFREAFLEAAGFKTGHGLRVLFFNLIITGAPCAALWKEFQELLAEDFIDKYKCNNSSRDRAINKALCHIDSMLRKHGKCAEDVGLPKPINDSSELDRERIRWDKTTLSNELSRWEPLLNSDQKQLYQIVVNDVLLDNKCRIFIDGAGGTGKTVLLRTITAKLRYENKIVICSASTGIAALNYDGGCTAHSHFKIPVETLDNQSYCNCSNRSERGNLLRNCDLIIWDEAPMAHRFSIESLDNTLRDLMGIDKPFGDKNIIFSGDFRQIPPVVKYGTKQEVIESSIKSSPIWKTLQIHRLTIFQRTISDTSYSKFLLDIGEGKIDEIIRNQESVIQLSNLKIFTEIHEIIDHVFPESLLSDKLLISKRCILSPTNKNIEQINKIILNSKIEGNESVLYSADCAVIEKHSNPDNKHVCTDILNKITETGVPDHKITVKVGALCILIRNLNFDEGLVNGTKFVIKSVGRFVIEGYKPENPKNTFLIPRINFKFTAGKSGIEIMRRQFPIRLAYALTINKSQGQTLDFVGVDLRENVFAHGQLYVALSRVRCATNISILSRASKCEDDSVFTANPVFKELLPIM